MRVLLKIISNIVFFIQVLLVFLLLFESKLTLPAWVQTIGRMHPLLLHIPIGLLLLTGVLWIFKGGFESQGFGGILTFVLHLTALAASITALMGFFLSKEEGYSNELLFVHKWSGLAVSFLCYALLLFYQNWPEKRIVFSTTLFITIPLLVVAGHYGASLTHGDDYIFQPILKEDMAEAKISDSTPIFTGIVNPIFKSKCFSCHNEAKAKGELIMTSVEKLLKGGKNGAVWISGDAKSSLIIQQLQLPIDDKKHMPPKGKPQLTPAEFELVYAWIQSGGDLKKAYRDYDEKDTLKLLVADYINSATQRTTQYTFKPVDPSTIRKLNDPFRSVEPLALNSPALRTNFFIRQSFNSKKLEELSSIKEQLVELNLSNMPVGDEDVKVIATFSNLEKLNLNNSNISGKTLVELRVLKNLRSLSLSGTAIDQNIASTISLYPSLREIFIWNTAISKKDALALQDQFKKIEVNYGFEPDENEMLKLTAPIVLNEDFILSENDAIKLKHNLPGVIIRYTTDGSDPDSTTSPVYDGPIEINNYTLFKTRACREKWFSSDVKEQAFFKKSFLPTGSELITTPEKDQQGEGVKTLFDGKKGYADLVKNKAWIGFRTQPFSALISFEKEAPTVSNITMSYLRNTGAMVFPPIQVEVWGGKDKENLQLLRSFSPEMPKDYDKTRNEGIQISIPPASFNYYRITARPLAKIPKWHYGKGQKAWVLIDELFFN